MAEAKTIVLPSRSEGIPNVALEALALQIPVVATSVGGIPEVIIHEDSGILVPSENPRALADAVRRILADPDFSERMASNGFRRVCEEFSVEARCRKVFEMYREIAFGNTSFGFVDNAKSVGEERP
jgi:glycosyltransferase involved in cell wall biosynthesis